MTLSMCSTDPSFALGAPRFSDVRLATLAASQGSLAAWKEAFAGQASVAEVLKGVSGNFAVGLLLADRRTVLAVDRFAIDSLCYRFDGDTLHFASRADALTDESTSLNPQAIFDYLYFHVIPSPRTIFAGVQRLPAGHFAVLDKGQLNIAAYWVPTVCATSRRRFEFELLGEPTTITRSHCGARNFTASWRFCVA